MMCGFTICLFGQLRLLNCDGQPLQLKSGKTQELLAYLLLSRARRHLREHLAGLLWHELPTAQALKNLRQMLWQLQTALGAAALLRVDTDQIGIDDGAQYTLDVDVFERAFIPAEGVDGAALNDEQAALLGQAVDLYRGDLLEGWYCDWCLFERERLQRLYLMMLDKLMGYCQQVQRYEHGILYGERILQCDCAHERTHRRLMLLRYLAGDRTGALRQYERCTAALRIELDVAPMRTTSALYQQIRDDRLATSRPASAPSSAALTDSAMLSQLRHLHHLLSKIQ